MYYLNVRVVNYYKSKLVVKIKYQLKTTKQQLISSYSNKCKQKYFAIQLKTKKIITIVPQNKYIFI